MNIPIRLYWNLLAVYLKPQRLKALLLGVLLLTSIGLQLLSPQILRSFIDTARAGADMRELIRIGVYFLVAALIGQVVSVAETYVAEHVGWTATNQLRADLMLHCLQLDPSFHSTHTPGELIERVDGDVATLGNFFSRFVVYVLGNALLMLGVLVLLIRIDWRVGAAMSTFAGLALFVINALREKGVPYWTAAREANARLFGYLEERLMGTEDIRSSGATGYALRGLHERSRDLLRRQRMAGIVASSAGNLTIVLLTLGIAAAFGLSASLYRTGAITLGTAYLIFSYTELLRRPIDQLTRQIQDLQQAGASIRRIQEILESRSSVADGIGPAPRDGALGVEVEHISFGYDDEGPVLQDVSFALPPGKVLGLLGRTGSGKTTLTRLLFRLYDPSAGTIRLGGVDLREPRVEDLRKRIGVVTQEIQLFHASVRDNLTFFDPEIPDQRIEEVLDELGLNAWYHSLPAGLETRLAPGGSGLSTGEAQSLAFARVFLGDPGLVILDEASSRLDPATEHHIERAIDRLLAGRTAIIIAHRLQTVHRADAIMILDRGQVVEYGIRAELVGDPQSRFSQLLRAGLEEALV